MNFHSILLKEIIFNQIIFAVSDKNEIFSLYFGSFSLKAMINFL